MNKEIKYKKFALNEELIKKARLLELAGDPTRIRLLCFMFEYKKACVSDIAESLDMSLASISHHLQVMKDNGFFTTERMGQNICYILVENDFMTQLKKVICDTPIHKGRLTHFLLWRKS